MKVFILGATGYIGGDALYAIANAHPEYDITALVRSSEKGALVASEYPKIKLVYGDNNSADVIKEEVYKADVVLHFADSADDVSATTTISNSILTRPTPSPIYYIHTSGTGVLTYSDQDRKTYGQESLKIYNDWEGIDEITSLPDHAPHRNVDKIVLAAGTQNPEVVKTAIVCPPCIYGPGRGPGNKTSLQVPILSALTLQRGHGVQVGEGKTHWNQVHVQDLSDVYVRLVEAAATAGGGNATWGAEGYYFAENGDLIWGEVARWIVAAAKKHNLIESDEIASYDYEEIDKMRAFGSYMWGASSRSSAIRARKLLGWAPRMPGLKDVVEETVLMEAKKLGKIPGHAKVAAGDA